VNSPASLDTDTAAVRAPLAAQDAELAQLERMFQRLTGGETSGTSTACGVESAEMQKCYERRRTENWGGRLLECNSLVERWEHCLMELNKRQQSAAAVQLERGANAPAL